MGKWDSKAYERVHLQRTSGTESRHILRSRRARLLITLLVVLLALFSVSAYSIYDSAGKSVDQLIDESRGIYHGVNHETPQESRKIWSKESGINFTMPGKLSGNSTSPNESRSSVKSGEGIEYQTASNMGGTQPQAGQESGSSSTSMTGSWSFELRDSKTRQLALNLFQSENAVFGEGSINDGGDTLQVSASGSAEGDKLNLDVTSSGNISLYRLALTMSGNSVSGDYRAFSTGGQPWTGIANGFRTQDQ